MHRHIIILVAFLFLIIGAVLFILLRSSTTPYTGPKSLENLSIKEVFPPDQSSSVGIFTPIRVIFNRPLILEEQSSVSILADPTFDAQGGWLENGGVFSFTPSSPLLPEQKYLLTVNFGPKKYSWEFTTVATENVSIEEQIKVQEKADRDFGEWSKNLYDNYPWYNNLPLNTNDYFVYFDPDKKQFFADLYPKTSSTIPQNNQVQRFKEEVTSKLQSFGIDLSKYPIVWEIKPEP